MKLGRMLHRLFGYPWIEAMEMVTFQRGDVLVVHVPGHWSNAQLSVVKAQIEPRLPEGVLCMVMSDETSLEVMRATDPLEPKVMP